MNLLKNEKKYTICPLSDIVVSQMSEEGLFLSSGLSLEHEFLAAIKELEYDKKIIHIRGNLNPFWREQILKHCKMKKEIEFPLSIEGEKFYAGIETMKL